MWIERRRFLRESGMGFGALAANWMMLHDQALGARVNPLAAKKPPMPASAKSVISLFMHGGPSHIDMWDPKPDAPEEIRGPFGHIPTKLPGVHVCEHLPLTARIMDKLTLIRSVDCSASDHTPITMQAGNPLARRTNDGRDGGGYPSMGSVAAKFRGANAPGMPGYVALADSLPSDIWGAGHLGGAFSPVSGKELSGRLALPEGLTIERLGDRRGLGEAMDTWKRRVEASPEIASVDHYTQQAFDVLMNGRAQHAFNLEAESPSMRDAYGRDSLGEKALLARPTRWVSYAPRPQPGALPLHEAAEAIAAMAPGFGPMNTMPALARATGNASRSDRKP